MSNGASRQPSTSSTFHLLAGLCSGLTSSLLLQPADLLKTRVQQSRNQSLLSTLRTILNNPNPVRHLWRGTLPSTIRTSIGSALYFTSLNKLRVELAKHPPPLANATAPSPLNTSSSALPRLSPALNVASGALARVSVGFIVMPITVLKVRFESSLYSYGGLGMWGAAKSIAKAEGLRGFFAGFGATAMRDAPYAGLYVLFYEASKRRLSELSAAGQGGGELESGKVLGQVKAMGATRSASINFASGTLAASFATAITNPPDAVKTRMQLMPEKYRKTFKTAQTMLREEGVRSLFDGLALRMARKAMSSALAWTVYEEVIRRAERGLIP